MGTVVKVQFGKKVEETPPQAEQPVKCEEPSLSPDERTIAECLLIDIDYARSGYEALEWMQAAITIGDVATDYIFSLANFSPNDSHLQKRREAVRTKTLKELCDMLISSNEFMWTTQPHFVGAIALELNDRLRVMQQCCPDLKIPQFK